MIDGFDDALIVEVNDVDLLVDHIGVEEGDLSGPPADVVPGFVVEDTDARGRAQDLYDFVLGGAPRVNLGYLILCRQVATLLDACRTARSQCGP